MDIPTPFGSITSAQAGGGIGSIFGLAGGLIGGNAASQAGANQAKAFEENALTAGENAARTREQLNQQRDIADYTNNRLYGKQTALYGAGGVAPLSGSPLDVMADTAQQIRQEAARRRYAGDFAARSAGEQANYDLDAAAAARKAGSTDALGSILKGIGTAAQLAMVAL